MLVGLAKCIIRLGQWKLWGVIGALCWVAGYVAVDVSPDTTSHERSKWSRSDALWQTLSGAVLFSLLITIAVYGIAETILKSNGNSGEIPPKTDS